MSDIVERLRKRYPQLEIDTDRKSVAWEAAAEIERLTHAVAIAGEEIDAHIDEIKRLQGELSYMSDEVVPALRNETERLRTELWHEHAVNGALRRALESPPPAKAGEKT